MADHGWVADGAGASAGTAADTAARTADATPRDAENAPGDTGTTDYGSRFPGCRPVRLLTDRLTDFEGRLEYWDARTGTAWVVAEPTGGIHGGTSSAADSSRGADRPGAGHADRLVRLVRDARGAPERMMQADETLYLHPGRARLPQGSLVIGEHDLPDVVLEVDHTTDVRPGKLPLYESWGFPELWVVVPPAGARRRRPAGVTIHRLESGRYRSATASRASPAGRRRRSTRP